MPDRFRVNNCFLEDIMKQRVIAYSFIFSTILFGISFQVSAQRLEPFPLKISQPAEISPSVLKANYGISLVNIPIQFSVVPGISSNPDYLMINNNLSVNLTMGSNFVVNGLQVSFLSNKLVRDLNGVQLAFFTNYAGGGVTGVQSSMIYNEAYLGTEGVQISGFVNKSSGLNGLQLGMINFQETGNSFQVGVLNWSQFRSEGAQLGLVNVGVETTTHQTGFYNSADTSHGAQIGFVNTSGYSDGLQVGVVNVSDDNQGYSIGMINILKNGRNNLEVNMNEMGVRFLQYRTGSQRFQFVYHLGYKPLDPSMPVLTGVGFSLKKPFPWVSIGYDFLVDKVSYNKIWDSGLHFMVRNQFVVEGEITPWFRIMVGASLNAFGSEVKNGDRLVAGKDHYDPVNKAWYRVGMGYTAGISLF